MLTQIKLTNFKGFKEETTFPLSRFNLLTGVNGGGKSSLLQALLLMRQSIEHNPYTTELILNGSCVNLGSFDDVRNRDVTKSEPVFFEFLYTHEKDKFSIHYHLEPKLDEMNLFISEIDMCLQYQIGIEDHEIETVYNTYTYDKGTETYLPLKNKGLYGWKYEYEHGYSIRLNSPSTSELSDMINTTDKAADSIRLGFNFDIDNIHYISADRIGPEEVYRKTPLPDFPHIDSIGEFTVSLLDKMSQELVNEELCLGDDARTLLTQTEAWLGKILDSVISLKITPLKVNILELLINGFNPVNIGFGYSSLLPIIVTGLIAKPNEKIIIENPEIHLHPKAQSALIEFLVKVANTGVQIFIESHSDHVLNALRIATKNKLIKPEDANILFFTQENGTHKIIQPVIDDNGRIDQWAHDFFDETAKSLASLAAGQAPRIKAPKV